MRYVYPAIFVKDEDSSYKVLFPDLDLQTDGKIMEEAFVFAKGFLKSYFVYVELYDMDFNLPTDYETCKKQNAFADEIMLIDAEVDKNDLKNPSKYFENALLAPSIFPGFFVAIKIFILILAGIIFLGTFVFLYQKSQPQKTTYELLTPQIMDLIQTTVVTGKIEPRDEVAIKPQISGIISDVCKEAGETISKGEIIAKVKVIPELGQLNSAESRVRLAKINESQATTDLERMEKLYERELISSEEYEKVLLSTKQAREELHTAQDNLEIVKEGKMPEKAVYSLTEAGETEFERLMFEIASKPISIFLDFNAVIVNLDSLPHEKQKECIAEIEDNIKTLKTYLETNIAEKESKPGIPATGMAVLRQQFVLVKAIEDWITSLEIE